MKKFWKPLILAAALTALCVAPAHALEYVAPSSVSLASAYGESSLTTLGLLSPQSLGGGFAGAPQYNIDGAEDYLFGRPTSDDTIYEWENPNVDRSKNTALIPPGFGTPTSYLPNSGEYLTPNLVPGALNGGLVNQVGSVGNPNGGTPTNATGSGYPAADTSVDSSGFPTVDTGVSGTGGQATAFTEVTSGLYYSHGSLGTLKIPSIGLTVGVYEGTGSAPLLKGAGHFEGTSIWNGNVAIAGHNRGVRNDFGKIHTLKYVGCYAPIGYMKSPKDKHVLIIDPVTAPVVKRIFDLRCQGYSYRKIATTLNAENVPTPTTFYYMRRDKPNIRKDGDFWAPPTVKSILRNEVYLGHMVQNKTGNLSYKIHKQIAKPESEWIRVENTHEPLISRETWDLVRELDARKAKFRSSKTGETALFTGVLFCMDCKSPMRHYRDGRKRKDGSPSTYQSYACNRYVTGGKTVCSGHIINQRVLTELLLIDIRFKAALAQNQPDTLKEKIMAQKNAAGLEQRKTLQATMDALDKRLAELEKLVVAAYEDKVKGAIPEAVCVQLMKRYEDERTEKLDQRTKLSIQLEACHEDEKAADNWLTMIRDYSKLEELDRPTLLRLVKRIEVGERRTVNGHDERDIKIYYNFVGFVEL